MNNAVVKVSISEDFYNTSLFNKEMVTIKTKCTNKKRANGLVIPFSNEIVLDEDGKDYVLSVIIRWYPDDWDSYIDKDFDKAFFIVKMNDEQFRMLNSSIDEFYSNSSTITNIDECYTFLCKIFNSVGILDKVRDLINNGYEFSDFSTFDELYSDSNKLFVHLTKIE